MSDRSAVGLQPNRVLRLAFLVAVFGGIVWGSLIFAQSISTVKFLRFDFVETRGRLGHEGLFPISGQPVAGNAQQVLAKILGPYNTAAFRFVSQTGDTIQTIDLTPLTDIATSSGEFSGLVQLPSQPFRVAVQGVDRQNIAYDVVFQKLFQAQTVEVNFDRAAYRLNVGTTTLSAAVTNHGAADKFGISVTSNLRLITRVEPSALTLNTGETQTFVTDVSVPLDMPVNTKVDIKAMVSGFANPGVSNSATLSLPVVRLPKIIAPPDKSVYATGELSPIDIGVAVTTDGLIPSNNAPSLFPVGDTILTWRVMDAAGNTATANQKITVLGIPYQIVIKSGSVTINASTGKFSLQGTYTVGPNSNGINPVTEAVIVTFGPFSQTLSPGSFTKNNKNDFVYSNKTAKGISSMTISGSGTFSVAAQNIDTSGINLSNPVTYTMKIGNDIGTVNIQFNSRGRY